ncbi:MAG: hypothetical protein HKN48_12935 [Flavobacteriaceae bacterium]|nr:hypothetical protein [Flavobacteriaceae bacterium]
MFEKLKRRSLQKHVERNLKGRDTSQINARLHTLGFLVDEMKYPDLEQFDDFWSILNLQPKDVKVFSFLETKKKLPSLRQNQVHNKDFNWKGEMHNQNAQEFLDREFDVLVGFYDGKHEFLDLMVSRSKAKFKVGFQNSDARLYDLLIAVKPSEFDIFGKELKKYLTILNKI